MTGLIDAVYALQEQAAGRTPACWQGALALDTLVRRGEQDRDILDAAAGLSALAMGERFELDERGRARAGLLAAVVQRRLQALNWLIYAPKTAERLISFGRRHEVFATAAVHKVQARPLPFPVYGALFPSPLRGSRLSGSTAIYRRSAY
jgi:hypothetical protein